jgi:hypothetical protein
MNLTQKINELQNVLEQLQNSVEFLAGETKLLRKTLEQQQIDWVLYSSSYPIDKKLNK